MVEWDEIELDRNHPVKPLQRCSTSMPPPTGSSPRLLRDRTYRIRYSIARRRHYDRDHPEYGHAYRQQQIARHATHNEQVRVLLGQPNLNVRPFSTLIGSSYRGAELD
jgi:hypothetical protein